MDLVLAYVLVVALFAGIPGVLDTILAYLSLKKTRKLLIEKASVDKLTLSELKVLLREVGKPPPGIPHLTRGIMALTVILVLGIAVFHIVVKGTAGDSSRIVDNVMSMLAGLLAAITGFYFGGRAVEKKEDEEEDKKKPPKTQD